MEHGIHHVDAIHNPEGLDVYRNLTHVLRVDNDGNIHIYTGTKVYVYNGDIEVKKDVYVSGDLDVRGDLYVNGTLKVKGAVTLANNIVIGGDIILYGTIIQATDPLDPMPNLEEKPTSPY